jgi:octaprenyl-diphosphate synthase
MPINAHQLKDCDPLSTLKSLLFKDLSGVDRIIDQQMSSSVPMIPALGRHLIKAGGKRLRPLLTLASYRLFQQDGEEAYGLAAAVEFIHNATLLHDDVIDESKVRRGVATANELWGNQASVLVGDFLFARSFQLMVAANNPQVLQSLANAAACISEGEVMQLSLCQKFDITMEECLQILEAKTATLFAAACEVGVLLTNHKEHASALRNYGLNLGLAFQIVDDILDYCANERALGKEVGNDFRDGKITLPIILTLPYCSEGENDFLKKTFIGHNQSIDDFNEVLKILKKYKGLEDAYALAEKYGKLSQQALVPIADHPIKDLLLQLIDYCLKRDH